MNAETPADVIEVAAKIIYNNIGARPAARALADAGLLADPADRDVKARLIAHRNVLRRMDRAEAEVAELEHRLACLLCELTGGRMSKTNYDVPTMVQEVEAYFERTQDSEVAELRATVDRVRGLADKWEPYGRRPPEYMWASLRAALDPDGGA